MVAYYFPPLGGIGSVRAMKFARYLPELGWEVQVLAPRNGAYFRDPSLAFPEAKVTRSFSLEISRAGKRATGAGGDDTRPAQVGRGMGRVRDLVRRWIYRPDPQVGWYPFAVAAGRRLLREQRFDAIFSSSFPVTAHLVARRLAQDSGLPWVAEFRDPWTDLTAYDSPLRRGLDQATEHSILGHAREIVTVSPRWRELYLARGAQRVSIVTNGFDPGDYPELEPPTRPTATYLGTFYSDRQDLATALRALGALRKSGVLPEIALRFVGRSPEPLSRLLGEVGLADATEITGYVTHQAALRHLAASSLLMLAGPAGDSEGPLRGQIPAKVFEYLGAQRPILLVADPEADVARLLRDMKGAAVVPPRDVAGAQRAIVSLLAAGPRVDRGDLTPWTRRFLAGQLAEALERAVR